MFVELPQCLLNLEHTMDATIDFSHNSYATPNGTLSLPLMGFSPTLWVVCIRTVFMLLILYCSGYCLSLGYS